MRSRVIVLAVSVLAGFGLAAPASAAPGSGTAPGARVTAGAGRSQTAAAVAVLLPTGDSVLTAPGPGGVARTLIQTGQRNGLRGSFLTARMGADSYVIPAIAKPYLDRYLDPGLFDVTRLQRLGSTRGQLPVRISFPAGAAPTLPGVTVTRRSSGVEHGYLTAASARSFGAALADQWQADAHAGWPASSPLFDGVRRVDLDDGVSPVAVHPSFPMLTLVVRVTDQTGKPVPFAFANLINVDDARRYVGFPIVINGEARVSVPAGHYAGIVSTDVFHPRTGTLDSRIMSITDYTVSTNLQTLTFDARTATSRVAVRTPRRADLQALNLTWTRTDRSGGGGLASGFLYGPGSAVFVQPAPPANVGALHWTTVWNLSAAADTYDLSYDARSVPADERRTVDAFQLATVHARYFTDVRQRPALFGRLPSYPFEFVAFGTLAPLSTPARRTEWIGVDPQAVWLDTLFANSIQDNPFGGFVSDGGRIYTADSVRQADWLRPALTPGVPSATNGGLGFGQGFFCPDCRTRGTMGLFLAPVTDSTPGHVGFPDAAPDAAPVARFQVFRDGVKVFDQADSAGVSGLPVPTGAATYRVLDDVARPGFAESTTSRTDLTFRSSASDGGPLPVGWFCPDGTTRCQVLPLLSTHLDLSTSLRGVLGIGRSQATLSVGHIQGAPTIPLRAVTVRLSFNGGTTWLRAPVQSAGSGRYLVTITNPASHAGDYVAVRMSASDAADGAITQTVQRAYVVSSS